MKVLVIGDEHTYGYGLSGGKLSYLGHFIRHISRTGQDISVEAYAHLTMPQIALTLAQLPLDRYDLIILQFNHNLLQSTKNDLSGMPRVAMPILPHPLALEKPKVHVTFLNRLKALKTALLSMVWPPYGLAGISALLKQLRPYRHNVLLLTPLPHRTWVSRWLQRQSRSILLEEADQQIFSVFDADSVIQLREEYFLPNDPEHLSAVSHELLGRVLFDFYQSAPTIVTVQSVRREQE
ncbi:SGNH/GDSL hydrolase family protein [Spirosoma validum]|uniref:SGNH/GDSL hydrolase family protein n=1 Tax=Spirosoma validum TaxID=2771355 RepID=A0A927GFL4_9BACT|nr:SGNH/GDSL hydrolase family protein [Spirosoma validum]MBD2756052.1 SGNH/GDSL hydrolase family protein [Spirosoma validum]